MIIYIYFRGGKRGLLESLESAGSDEEETGFNPV